MANLLQNRVCCVVILLFLLAVIYNRSLQMGLTEGFVRVGYSGRRPFVDHAFVDDNKGTMYREYDGINCARDCAKYQYANNHLLEEEDAFLNAIDAGDGMSQAYLDHQRKKLKYRKRCLERKRESMAKKREDLMMRRERAVRDYMTRSKNARINSNEVFDNPWDTQMDGIDALDQQVPSRFAVKPSDSRPDLSQCQPCSPCPPCANPPQQDMMANNAHVRARLAGRGPYQQRHDSYFP